MKSSNAPILLQLILVSCFALAQNTRAKPEVFTAEAVTPQLSADQIRDLIRQAAAPDIENDSKQRDYTYIQRQEEHKLDGKGQVKSSESRTYEIMVLYEEQVRKLIAKNDRLLPDNDAGRKMRTSGNLSRSV